MSNTATTFDKTAFTAAVNKFLADKTPGQVYIFDGPEAKGFSSNHDTVSIWYHNDAAFDKNSVYPSYNTKVWWFNYPSYTIETFTKMAAEHKGLKAFADAKENAPSGDSTLIEQLEYWFKFCDSQPDYSGFAKIRKSYLDMGHGIGASKKVSVSWWYDWPQVQLEACTTEELFWLLDQPAWRHYEKWNLFDLIASRMLNKFETTNYRDEKVVRYVKKGVHITELLPVCGTNDYQCGTTMETEIEFPFTSTELKTLLETYDVVMRPNAYSQFGKIDAFDVSVTPYSVIGVNYTEKEGISFSKDPKNWVKSSINLTSRVKKALREFTEKDYMSDQNAEVLAYDFILNGKDHLPAKGSLHTWERVLSAMYGQRNWREGIDDNTYSTHSYGWVGSYSGLTLHEDCGITIFGTGPKGNAWIVSKEGGVYFKK